MSLRKSCLVVVVVVFIIQCMFGKSMYHPINIRNSSIEPFFSSSNSYEKAKKDLAKGLTYLETHLKTNNTGFLVGSQITLADIVVASTLLYPFKLVTEPAYLQPFPTVVTWFQQCMGQAEFQQVVGHVVLCQKELKAPAQS